jgi:branched-chain amino acid transport system substrate-binding protein
MRNKADGPRMTGRRTVLAGGSAFGLASGLAMPAIAQNKPIRMGWIAAVTGAFSSNAQAQDWGFHTMVQDLNDAGGVDGRKLEIVMRDSAGDPSKAVSFAKELVYNEKVDVVCGPINSGEVLPTLGVISGGKTLQMVGGVIDELVDPVKYPLVFRNLNTNTQYIKIATRFCLEKLNRKKIAIIDDNTGYGVLAMQGLVKMLDGMGLKPAFTITVDPAKTDVTDEIIKARASGADVIQTWTNASGFMARVLNARGEQQWDVPIVANPSIYQDQVGALLSKPAYWENAYAAGYANSVTDANGKLPPTTQAFLDKHKEGAAPYIKTAVFAIMQGATSAFIPVTGWKKAGTTEPFATKAALESIPVIDTPYGRFTYTATDHNGFGDDGMAICIANSRQPDGSLKSIPL